jgi:hypothetical protein
MTKNPILDELHATRRKLLDESGGTLAGLVARLQAEQEASGRTILKTPRTNPSKSVPLPVESQSSPSGDR